MAIINGYRQYLLNNGLVVALQNTPTKTFAAELRVNYGSSHEGEGEEGMAHFLEHCLVTGGSVKYDPITADEIRCSFGYSNAFTNIGRTNFVVNGLSEDLEPWLDYISDHIFRPRFDSDRVNGERGRILREIADKKSNPVYIQQIKFNEVFYRGHPKGIFNLGKEEVVKYADAGKIRAFHSKGFHPNNIDLIIAGALPKNIEELITNHFGNIPRGQNTRKEFPELKPLQEKSILHYPAPELDNSDNPKESSAGICLAYLGPVIAHEDEYAVRIMSHILGGDTNSLLFKNLGLRKGLAYDVKTSYDGSYNAGELNIHADVPAKRIDETIDTIFEEINRMKNQKVNERTLERIRRKVKYNIAQAFESNDGHVSTIKLKLDEGLTQELLIDSYNKVNPEKILEVSNRYLPDREKGNYVLSIRDPLKK